MTFGKPLGPIAAAERELRANLGAQLVASGKIRHADADENARIWSAIAEWATARDAGINQALQCGWETGTREATRVAAAALKAFVAGDTNGEARAVSLCKLAGTIANAADVWTAPIGTAPGDAFAQAYLDALQAANPVQMADAA